MAEYRPDASDLWQKLGRRFPLIRRIALALGAAMVAGAVCACLRPGSDAIGTAAFGGAIIGFFAARLSPRGDLGGDDADATD